MLLLAALALPQLLSAQDAPAPILTRAFSRTDWELSDIGDARFGRVAVVESPDGPQVELRRLLLRAPVSHPISARSSTPPFERSPPRSTHSATRLPLSRRVLPSARPPSQRWRCSRVSSSPSSTPTRARYSTSTSARSRSSSDCSSAPVFRSCSPRSRSMRSAELLRK